MATRLSCRHESIAPKSCCSAAEDWPNGPRNSLALIDRHGSVVLHYSKVHTCDFGDEALLTSGREFPVAKLDAKSGTVRI